MERRTHAAMGARTLGPTPPMQAWGDAFRSIELVGTTAGGGATRVLELPADPIDVARAWLAHPDRALLPGTVRAKAEASLDIAAAHVRELDLLAGQLAMEANDG